MICPRCGHQIREEQRHLMSRDPEGEMVWTPALRKLALLVLLFVIVVGLLSIVHTHLPL